MSTDADYQRLGGLRWTALKALAESPAHYRAALEQPREDTDSLALGRLIHVLALTPERQHKELAVWPESAGRRAGERWAAFVELNVGREIVREQDFESAARPAAAVRAHPWFREVIDGAMVEHTLQWDHPLGPMKARLDLYSPERNLLVDLKSTRSTEVCRFGADAVRYLYDLQLVHYARGVEAVFGRRPELAFIAVETSVPYDVAVFTLDGDALERAELAYEALLERLALCQASNHWPGRYEHPQPLAVPSWAYPSDDLLLEPE